MVATSVEARKGADPRRRKSNLIESDFNQLLSLTGPVGTTMFQYDSNGNQTQKQEPSGTTAYTWDARDRLTQVTSVVGTSRFGYDTFGLRVAINNSEGARRVVLDGVEELAEYDASSGTQRVRFDHDVSRVDALLAQITNQRKNFFVGDALGSVYGMVDQNGGATAKYTYDAYGSRSAQLEQVPTQWAFTGRRFDGAAMGYYRARYYTPSTGSWIHADPIGFDAGQTRMRM